MAAAWLDQRGMLAIAGEDARGFLQGIITNDIRLLAPDRPLYACFLTPQGKYQADFFLYVTADDTILLDVDKQLLPRLLRQMTLFRLRSKVTLADVSDDYRVAALWGDTTLPAGLEKTAAIAVADPRCAALGYRVITTADHALLDGVLQGDVAVQGDYRLWQMRNGVADWCDFEDGRTAMLEANMDFLNALSWDKGCYLGQELTARTYYRGLTKRRFFPVRLPQVQVLESNAPVTVDGKTIGFVRGWHGDYALAHLAVDAVKENRGCTIAGMDCTVEVPEWLDLDAATQIRK